MSRKMVFVFCIVALLSLIVSGSGLAQGEVPTWEETFVPDGFSEYYLLAMEKFNSHLYAAVSGVPGLQIWRTADGANWEPVSDFGLTDGPYTWFASWDMVVFQNQLYVAALDYFSGLPATIFRTPDGIAWEKVITNDFGGSLDIWKFQEFKGMLYVTASSPYISDDVPIVNQVWRSATGDEGSWVQVGEFPNMYFFADFEVYKGALYAISDWSFAPDGSPLSTQVWRTYDGLAWEAVVMDGFGNPLNNNGGGFETFGGYLYAAVGDPTLNSDGGEVYRTQNGMDWERVVTAGLGNPNNYKFDGLITYLDDLYLYSVNDVDGCQVFRSKDGLTWVQVNESGWGDPLNAASHLGAAQSVFKGDLYMAEGNWYSSGKIVRLVHPDK